MPRRMSEVSAAAEKPRKQVEGIVRLSSRIASLPMLLHSLVSILIVDLARGGCRKNVICLGDFDKFLACVLVASA